MLAFLGSNLLKSFDTFIISFILGPVSVAFYNVPLRLVEVIEMPLKSALNVGFPKFSALHNKGCKNKLNIIVGEYIGVLTFLYLPFMVMLFFFAEELILLTGGEQYIAATPIFQIFIVYGLIIPFDRITGVVLDAVGKPKLNSRKVFYMALTNIVGDIIVLNLFDSLEPVAIVTVLNVIVGAFVGFYLVSKNIGFKLSHISIGAIKNLKININSKKYTL
jgi:O-antigen/teichoic acid export membrane protein